MIDGRLVPDVLADLRDLGSLAHVNLLIEVNAGPIAAIHRPPRGKSSPGKVPELICLCRGTPIACDRKPGMGRALVIKPSLVGRYGNP
jgi:hypothetical protein